MRDGAVSAALTSDKTWLTAFKIPSRGPYLQGKALVLNSTDSHVSHLWFFHLTSYSYLYAHTRANTQTLAPLIGDQWAGPAPSTRWSAAGPLESTRLDNFSITAVTPWVSLWRVVNKGHDPEVRSVTPGAGRGPTAKSACCLLWKVRITNTEA